MMRPSTRLLQAGLSALHYSGLARALAPVTGGLGAIFMLHRVVPGDPAPFEPNRILKVTPEFLELAIQYVQDQGFDVVSLDEAQLRLSGGETGKRFVCFTFDDGYRDNLEFAYPIFKREGLPFAIYVPSDYPDGGGELWWLELEQAIARLDHVALLMDGRARTVPARTRGQKEAAFESVYWWLRGMDEAEARGVVRRLCAAAGYNPSGLCTELIMSWDDLRRLASDPLVTIGAHTRRHYAVSKLSPADARLEIEEGARRIEQELGVRPRHFSFPYGDETSAGPRDFDLVDDLGFATAVTTRKGLLAPPYGSSLMELPRLSLNGDFQRASHLNALLSGVPFALFDAAKAVRARRRPEGADGRPASGLAG